MLKLISIRNFAVVTKATMELTDGLNLLTGETGSGKSIFVDALGLLLGGRGSSDVVRGGESAAVLEGIFEVERNSSVERIASEAGIDLADGELIVRREITDRSRSRAYVNDRLTTVALLKDMRPFLLDIHGQGDQQSLLYPEAHLDLLDEFAGLAGRRAGVARAHAEFARVKKELQGLRHTEAERLRSLDMLGFQIGEIGRAGLSPGEDDLLARERAILVNAEKLVQLGSEAYSLLYDSEASALQSVSQVERKLEQIARVDARFDVYLDQVRTAKYGLEDLAYFLRDYLQDVDFSPERLKVVDDRLDELDRLKRKYGTTIPDVLALLEDLRTRFEQLSTSEDRATRVSADLSGKRDAYLEAAADLGRCRLEAASRLEERVMAELGELAMENTQFVVRVDTGGAAEDRFTERGMDRVEFHVATNPGEEPKPLARIASGGEISRLMLALKTVSAPPEIPRTLVFDEVDVGIGGRVSEAIGQRLWDLSRANQVLCVTHQAQIARFADTHFCVRKALVGERAVADVVRLDRKGRIDELARMIGGADATETARRHARELLKAR